MPTQLCYKAATQNTAAPEQAHSLGASRHVARDVVAERGVLQTAEVCEANDERACDRGRHDADHKPEHEMQSHRASS
jgi:hypothetical protein